MIDATFSRDDHHTARVDEVAETAGSSKPTMYHHPGSKEGIFIACVCREADRLVEAIGGAVHDFRAPRDGDRLHRGMPAFFTFVTDNRDSWTAPTPAPTGPWNTPRRHSTRGPATSPL